MAFLACVGNPHAFQDDCHLASLSSAALGHPSHFSFVVQASSSHLPAVTPHSNSNERTLQQLAESAFPSCPPLHFPFYASQNTKLSSCNCMAFLEALDQKSAKPLILGCIEVKDEVSFSWSSFKRKPQRVFLTASLSLGPTVL